MQIWFRVFKLQSRHKGYNSVNTTGGVIVLNLYTLFDNALYTKILENTSRLSELLRDHDLHTFR